MKYKNYYARIEYDEEDNILVGHVTGINSIIGFHAEDLKTLEAAFHEAVDAYLDHCAQVRQSSAKDVFGANDAARETERSRKGSPGSGAIRQKPKSMERGGLVARRARRSGVTNRMTRAGAGRRPVA